MILQNNKIKNMFDRDELYNKYIQLYNDFSNDKINELIDKVEFIFNSVKNTHTTKDIKDLMNFDEEEINEIYNEIIINNK